MAAQYKNLLILVQTLLLLLAGYHLYQKPEQQLLQQAAVLPASALPESSEVATKADLQAKAAATAVAADTLTPAPDVVADNTTNTTDTLPQSDASGLTSKTQLAAVHKTQQLWSRHMDEGVDLEWAQQYQQELQDFFVTESALKKFNASDIQCRQSSCRLQLKLPEMADATQQQLVLATALNPLREQGKIGVYLIGEVSGEQLQLVIERPEQAE